MRTYITALVLAFASLSVIAGTNMATASSDHKYRRYGLSQNVQSHEQIREALEAKGYKVTHLKRDDRYYEAYVRDAAGVRFELYVHPVTGRIFKKERKH